MAREEFSPEHPVHNIGLRDDILDLILNSIELSRNEPPHYQLLLGTMATQVIARLLSALKHGHARSSDCGTMWHGIGLLFFTPVQEKNRLDSHGLSPAACKIAIEIIGFWQCCSINRNSFRCADHYRPKQARLQQRRILCIKIYRRKRRKQRPKGRNDLMMTAYCFRR